MIALSPRAAAQEGALDALKAALMFSIDPSQSAIRYQIDHTLHRVDAISKRVEGNVLVLPTGVAQLMVRVPVDSFDSRNSFRDSQMKEVTESARYPLVELSALCAPCPMPTTYPTRVERTLQGELSFHGITKDLEVPVTLVYDSARLFRAAATLTLSLKEFQVERPSLMLVKVDDALKIDVSLILKQ